MPIAARTRFCAFTRRTQHTLTCPRTGPAAAAANAAATDRHRLRTKMRARGHLCRPARCAAAACAVGPDADQRVSLVAAHAARKRMTKNKNSTGSHLRGSWDGHRRQEPVQRLEPRNVFELCQPSCFVSASMLTGSPGANTQRADLDTPQQSRPVPISRGGHGRQLLRTTQPFQRVIRRRAHSDAQNPTGEEQSAVL